MPSVQFVRSRFNIARAMLTLMALLTGCSSGTQAPRMIPIGSPRQQASAAPKYCSATNDVPPQALASNPAYVQFSVSVLGQDSSAATSLTASDFRVTEGQLGIPIAFFKSDTEVPQSVAILIDRSQSMVAKLAIVRRTVGLLVHTLLPCDDVLVYAFGGEPMVVQDFSVDKSELEERLKRVRAAGGTPLFDSIRQGLAAVDKGHYPDRSVVLFTDGVRATIFGDKIDNQSKSSRDEIIATLKGSGARLFVVGVGSQSADWGFAGSAVNAENLRQFVHDTGTALYLIHGTPDKSAPKERSETSSSDPIMRALVPAASPLVPDSSELEQTVISIAAQIDHGYSIGAVASSAASARAGDVRVSLVGRPQERLFVHRTPSN